MQLANNRCAWGQEIMQLCDSYEGNCFTQRIFQRLSAAIYSESNSVHKFQGYLSKLEILIFQKEEETLVENNKFVKENEPVIIQTEDPEIF